MHIVIALPPIHHGPHIDGGVDGGVADLPACSVQGWRCDEGVVPHVFHLVRDATRSGIDVGPRDRHARVVVEESVNVPHSGRGG